MTVKKRSTKILNIGVWLLFLLALVVVSCQSNSKIPKKSRKLKPCDCPVFGFVMQNDAHTLRYAYISV